MSHEQNCNSTKERLVLVSTCTVGINRRVMVLSCFLALHVEQILGMGDTNRMSEGFERAKLTASTIADLSSIARVMILIIPVHSPL